MLFMYFSIVLLRAACASLDKASASLMMTTTPSISGPWNYEGERSQHTLEALFGVQVHLLCLRNFLQDVLDHYSVIHSHIPKL